MRLPEFTTYLVRFRLRSALKPEFAHTTLAYGYFSGVLGHPLPTLDQDPPPQWTLTPQPIEFGRSDFKKGDQYEVGLTFTGRSFPSREKLDRLIREQSASPGADGRRPNAKFEFVEILSVRRSDLHAQAERVRSLKSLKLRFVTPLAILQRIPDRPSIHFDATYFNIENFFLSLYKRMLDLSKLDSGPAPEYVRPDVTPVSLSANRLGWYQILPVDQQPDRPAYAGAIGSVALTGDFFDCAERLVWGQYLHIGRWTNFGFGRYCIDELSDFKPLVLKPEERTEEAPARPKIRGAGGNRSRRK